MWFWTGIRTGVVRFLRHRVAAACIFLSIILGVGVNAVVVSGVATVLFGELHVTEPDELHDVVLAFGRNRRQLQSHGVFGAIRARGDLFSGVVAHARFSTALTTTHGTRLVTGRAVSWNYMDVLGLRFAAGRGFNEADVVADATAPRAIISDDLRRQLAFDESGVVGQGIRLNGAEFTVIGVAPPGFRGLRRVTAEPDDVWVLLPSASRVGLPDDYSRFSEQAWLGITARLNATVSADIVGQQLKPSLVTQLSKREFSRVAVVLLPADRVVPALERSAYFLGVLSVLVLAMTCFNVGAFTAISASTRDQEMRTRAALGALPWQLTVQRVGEIAVIVFGCGLAGYWVAWLGQRGLNTGSGTETVALSPVLGAGESAVVAAVILGVIFTVTATFGSRMNSPRRLASVSSRWMTPSTSITRSSWLSAAMLIPQVAGAVVLVAVALVLAREARTESQRHLGYAPASSAFAAVNADLHGYDDSRLRALYDSLQTSLGAATDATFGFATWPSMTSETKMGFLPQTSKDLPGTPQATIHRVDPGVLDMAGFQLVSGRFLDARDARAAAPGLVIDRHTAETFWSNSGAVGQVVSVELPDGLRTFRVVGVVDTVLAPNEPSGDGWVLYLPRADVASSDLVVHIQGQPGLDSAALADRVRNALRRFDPGLLILESGSLAGYSRREMMTASHLATATSVLASVCLLVAIAGITSVSSLIVTSRRREIAVRLALGSSTTRLISNVATGVVMMVIIGAVLGVWSILSGAPEAFLPINLPGPLVSLAVSVVVSAGLLGAIWPVARAVGRNSLTALQEN